MDSEDRTPGRLQAVWPPPKPKDEEEKVGLKYTEAGKNHPLISSDVVFVCVLSCFYFSVSCKGWNSHQFQAAQHSVGGDTCLTAGRWQQGVKHPLNPH